MEGISRRLGAFDIDIDHIERDLADERAKAETLVAAAQDVMKDQGWYNYGHHRKLVAALADYEEGSHASNS